MSKIDKLFEGAMKATAKKYEPLFGGHGQMKMVKTLSYKAADPRIKGAHHIYVFDNGREKSFGDGYEIEVAFPDGRASTTSRKFETVEAAITGGKEMVDEAVVVGYPTRHRKGVVSPAKIIPRPSKAGKRTVKSEFHKVLKNIGGIDQTDFDENPSLLDYADESSRQFVQEYWTNEFDPQEISYDDVGDAVGEEVSFAVQDNATKSMWEHEKHAVEQAIEQSAERAKVPLTVNITKKGVLEITFDKEAMVRAWAEETEGIGLAAWDPSLRAKDITSAVMVTNILMHRDEVYGGGSMKRTYEDQFDRFEPDTGSYMNLKKVADKAYRTSLKKKHRP